MREFLGVALVINGTAHAALPTLGGLGPAIASICVRSNSYHIVLMLHGTGHFICVRVLIVTPMSLVNARLSTYLTITKCVSAPRP